MLLGTVGLGNSTKSILGAKLGSETIICVRTPSGIHWDNSGAQNHTEKDRVFLV